MSIALDLALFLRENHLLDSKAQKITISSSLRGFLFTLMFRVGSNPYSWIPQEELALEMDMTIDGLKKITAKVVETGLIEIGQNPHDKRKNCYRPAEFLINYHQSRREKSGYKCRSTTNVGVKYVPKRAPNSEKYVPVCTPNSEDRCPNVPIISCTNDSNPTSNNGSKLVVHSLKQHKDKIKEREKAKGALSQDFKINEENKNLLRDTAQKSGKPENDLLIKFKSLMKIKDIGQNEWQERLSMFLVDEKPVMQLSNVCKNTKEMGVSGYGNMRDFTQERLDREKEAMKTKTFQPIKIRS